MTIKKISILMLFAFLTYLPLACDDDTSGGGGNLPGECANSALDTGETCDDGNLIPGDGCSETCQVEEGWTCPNPGENCNRIEIENCGNRLLDENETCDDGNKAAGDGCNENCQIEDGWLCPITGQSCLLQPEVSKCGNWELDEEEECEDGNAKSGDGCSEECKIEEGYACDSEFLYCWRINICGNGLIEAANNEECDDSNANSGDGCDENCKIEEDYTCPLPGVACVKMGCGNGILEEGEQCDLGENRNTAVYGVSGCMANCQIASFCGDAKIDLEHNEICDDGKDLNLGGYMQCRADCSGLGTFCGDGKRTHAESCDDGNQVAGDGCDDNCKTENGFYCPANGGACVQLLCGNGILNEGEQCDDGNLDPNDGCSPLCRKDAAYKCPIAGQPCIKVVCGDGIFDFEGGEQCDDANTLDGDGCSVDCKLERGWVCPIEGKACVARLCGDGIVARGEACDDGNRNEDDGCDERCQLEVGYHCPTPNAPCVTISCGDGKLEGLEQCDDGNKNNSDGCSSLCRIEEGYKCDTPAQACTPIVCGDGKIEGIEQCDDGNANNSDGCSSHCKIEVGFHCPTPNTPCVHSNCGNKLVEGLEQCDDGNDAAGDGCSPLCELEPIFSCTDGECKPVCGDGITLWVAGEECDDGNLISGDGCSSECKKESGFACTEYGHTPPPSIRVPIVYRDFRSYEQNGTGDGYITQAIADAAPQGCFRVGSGHPDFDQYGGGGTKGLIYDTLGPDGRPIMKWDGTGGRDGKQISCEESFNMWYRSVPGVNIVIKDTLELTQSTTDPRTYLFNSSNFFSIDGKGYGNYQNPSHNYGFTSEFQAYFQYRGGETLLFSGDDDVWVFINGKLALDLGGLHSPLTAQFILGSETHPVTGKKWDSRFNIFEGGVYSIVLFHAERHYTGSNFRLTLAGFLNMGTTECNVICGDGLVRGNEECDTGLPENEAKLKGCDNCKLKAYCGNEIVEYPEHCDDKNDPNCVNCTYAYCNNGVLDTDKGEQCDGELGLKPGENCLPNCKISRCGDAYVDASTSEECDDGNTSDDDLCTSLCKRPYCGDAIVSLGIGEVCDDGVNDGSYSGCSLDCSFRPPYCGDGIIDTIHGETCDDGVNDGAYYGCTNECKIGPRCGDGIRQAEKEECDDGNLTDRDGCDQLCRIEQGASCVEDENGKTVCTFIN